MTEYAKIDECSVLITGVAGFIGRHVAAYYRKNGWTTFGVDILSQENAPIADLNQYFPVKLPSAEFSILLKEIKPDLCIHCAGRASIGLSVSAPDSDFESGPPLVFEILNQLRQHAPECRFIFLSSAAVYGNPVSLPVTEDQIPNPISPYGYHKWQCELLCREFSQIYRIRTANVRIFSTYGPGLRRQVLWDICRKAIVDHDVTLLGTGDESRDFIHINDVSAALFHIAQSAPMNGEVYNLGSGEEIKISKLAGMVAEALEYKGQIRFNGKVPAGNPLNWRADISNVMKLGFAPSIPIAKGVKTFAQWCSSEMKGI